MVFRSAFTRPANFNEKARSLKHTSRAVKPVAALVLLRTYAHAALGNFQARAHIDV